MTLVAVDLGGTRLKAGQVSESEPVPADILSFEHDGDWKGALHRALEHFGRVEDVALCVPGLVDDGRVVSLPGKLPGIEGTDLGAAVGVPVTVANDAVAYGAGEAVHGAGRGFDRVVVVTLGTGVGVAVLEDGRPLGRGALGGGILGGQIPLPGPEGGPVDTSGRRGTFEARCRADSLLALVPTAKDLPTAYELLRSQHPQAVEGFTRYRGWLICGLAVLALAYAPSAIVVGGGAAQVGLLDDVEEALALQLWPGQSVAVRPAELGDSAALAGLGVLRKRGRS